jgi:hypothetical protein
MNCPIANISKSRRYFDMAEERETREPDRGKVLKGSAAKRGKLIKGSTAKRGKVVKGRSKS